MIALPFPLRPLWPNARPHWRSKAAAVKKARAWAYAATLADLTRPATVGRIVVTFYPKPRGPLPDRDGCVAALKAYLDGIADALKVNDRDFPVPIILFGERTTNGSISIILEP